jgi:hypothetical protein
MANIEATVGGLTFVGHEGPATYTIAADGLKGWFVGGTSMRREYVDRPNQPGQFSTPGYLSGRLVEITGKVLVDDDAVAFEDALDALDALLEDGGSDTLTVTTPKGAKTATVFRYGEPQLRILVYGSVAEYQIQLWAPDPEKVVVP